MMLTWHCPSCRRVHKTDDDVTRCWCGTCRDTPTSMHRGVQMYEVYCGNYECPSRAELVLWPVEDGVDLVDGEVWLCPRCRPIVVDVETELL